MEGKRDSSEVQSGLLVFHGSSGRGRWPRQSSGVCVRVMRAACCWEIQPSRLDRPVRRGARMEGNRGVVR